MPEVTVAFLPLDFVVISYLGLKYNGRVNKVIVRDGDPLYEVEYANDKGDLDIRQFRGDELKTVYGQPKMGFV